MRTARLSVIVLFTVMSCSLIVRESHASSGPGCKLAFAEDGSVLRATFLDKIVGEGSFQEQMSRVYKYVLTKTYDASGAELVLKRAADLEELLSSIRRSSRNEYSRGNFDFSRNTGSDGSVAFIGLMKGHALVVAPNGHLYRGTLPLLLFATDRVWQADYSNLREIIAP